MIGLLEPQQLGQAEIGDLHSPALVDQDVLGLDVAVDDAFVVSELQGVANLRHDRQRLLRRHPAGLNRLPQVHAVDIFHDEEIQPLGLAEIVDGDDVRMAQPGQRAGFAREPLGKRRIVAGFHRQNLDRHQPIEPRLPGFVDRPHAPLAQQFEDFKLRKSLGQFFDLRAA